MFVDFLEGDYEYETSFHTFERSLFQVFIYFPFLLPVFNQMEVAMVECLAMFMKKAKQSLQNPKHQYFFCLYILNYTQDFMSIKIILSLLAYL